MELVTKRFTIALDIKRPASNREFEVVEGDNGNVLEITVTDDGAPVNMADCFVLAVFSKSDGRTAAQDNNGNGITIDEGVPNVAVIDLYMTSFTPGLVECELQVFSGEGQRTLVTSAKFNFLCRRAIANGDTYPETDEWPILVEIIDEVQALEDELHLLNEETAEAAAAAHGAATRANAAAEYAEQINADFTAAEAMRVANESGRIAAEHARIATEGARVAAEAIRDGAEHARTVNEERREENEDDREAAEAGRLSAETARAAAEEGRSGRDGAFRVWEQYSPIKAYVPLNKVSYNGSSYLCIANTLGAAPPNATYWLLIAAKGADGQGAGDMLKTIYDANDSGVVDDAKRLGGKLPSDYSAAAHAHGNITSQGTIGTAANKAIFTDTGGKLTADFLPVAAGGTGAASAWAARTNLQITPENIGAAPATHASQHAGTGSDPIAPSDIGAAEISRPSTVTLMAGAWAGAGPYTQTVAAAGMAPNSKIIVSPQPGSFDAYAAAAVRCGEKGAGTLMFSAAKAPAAALDVDILIVG